MKEIHNVKVSYILSSSIFVILGIILLVWPDLSLQLTGYIVGFALLAAGITYGIIYFVRDHMQGILQMDLVIGVVCIAFGCFNLLNHTFFITIIPICMGIILILSGVIKIQNALNMRRLGFHRWYMVLGLAILMILLAIILIANPFAADRWMLLYLGISMLADGMINLVSMILIMIQIKKLRRIGGFPGEPFPGGNVPPAPGMDAFRDPQLPPAGMAPGKKEEIVEVKRKK